MILRTEISPKKTLNPISHSESIGLIGSCFTQSIGNKLNQTGFATDINPFGIIYNPSTISQCLESISTKRFLKDEDLVFTGDFFKSYSHHGDFKSENEEGLLGIINQRIEESNKFIKDAKCLILTLGSAWVYLHNDTNRIMGNCHKMNANLFTKKLLSISEISESLKNSINLFFNNNKNDDSKVIITISPIRHWKDGYRENQISKSILHLATEEICKENPRIEYFPSYEILMDDLRDYRFYADDMLHPNNLAVEYIWEKFQEAYFNADTIKLAKRFEDLQRMKEHRVFNPDTDSHKTFLKKIDSLEQELRVEKNK